MLRSLSVCFLSIILMLNTAIAAPTVKDYERFIQNYLSSFASRDAEGVFQLINWEGVDSKSQKKLKKQIRGSFRGRQIRRIFFTELDTQFEPTFTKDGKLYRFNLEPTSKLNIIFISNRGKRTTKHFYVGNRSGMLLVGNPILAH